MKKIIFLLITIIILISLTGCSEMFSKKDIKYLSNPENYKEYTVKYQYISNTGSQGSVNQNKLLSVTFYNLEELNYFQSSHISDSNQLDSYPISFLIHYENNKLLTSNKFYDEVKAQNEITIWACNYKTKNSSYYYICSIESDTKIYLDKDSGMENIIDYLENNKSPFFQ